jgi:hypothetical protein
VALVQNRRFGGIDTSFIRVTRIGELGTTLMKEVLSFYETSVVTRATRRNIAEDAIIHSHRRENLNSYSAHLGLVLLSIFSGVLSAALCRVVR